LLQIQPFVAAEKTTALVVKVVDFSETSKVATLFTRDWGKIGALAKGARRLRGPFEAGLDLLTVCRIVCIRKRSDSLDLLTEAEVIKRFRAREVGGYYAGCYVAELLVELTEEDDPHERLFDAAVETLDRLAERGYDPLTVLHFELAALGEAGFLPTLDRCVVCGQEALSAARGFFGIAAGGVLCANCRPGQSKVVSLSTGALRTLETLAASGGQAWQRLQPGPGVLGEVRSIVSGCLTHVLGHPPRMLAILAKLT
jgi:DNA repair protein RecO (recombination protein O)